MSADYINVIIGFDNLDVPSTETRDTYDKYGLFPTELTSVQVAYTYANEADMLNVVLFGKTAGQWKDANPMLRHLASAHGE